MLILKKIKVIVLSIIFCYYAFRNLYIFLNTKDLFSLMSYENLVGVSPHIDETYSGGRFRWVEKIGIMKLRKEGSSILFPIINLNSKKINIKIFIDNNKLDEITLEKGEITEKKYHLPENLKETFILTFKVDKTFIPDYIGRSIFDFKTYGFGLGEIKWEK